MYGAVRICIEEMGRNLSILIPAGKLTLISWCIFSVYGAIRLTGILAIALMIFGIFTVGTLGVLLTVPSNINQDSKLLIDTLGRVSCHTVGQNKGWFSKKVKTLQAIGVSVGKMYCVDKPLILHVGQIIVDGVLFLLLNN